MRSTGISGRINDVAQPASRRWHLKLAVFGLGYVGSVSRACLARMGHTVIGVDLNADKVAMLNAGQRPVVEERLGELTGEMVAAGQFSATTDTEAADGWRCSASPSSRAPTICENRLWYRWPNGGSARAANSPSSIISL